jgi:sporulation protein YlmC with PRC-barrel domain
MKIHPLLAATVAAALIAGAIAADDVALAQGAAQSVMLIRVDPQNVATGYRVSKVRGSTVYNDSNESIGKVDDIIISVDGKNPFAVLSAGGFLGIGDHLVALPYQSLKITDERIVLPGGTREQLKALPQFTYATK